MCLPPRLKRKRANRECVFPESLINVARNKLLVFGLDIPASERLKRTKENKMMTKNTGGYLLSRYLIGYRSWSVKRIRLRWGVVL